MGPRPVVALVLEDAADIAPAVKDSHHGGFAGPLQVVDAEILKAFDGPGAQACQERVGKAPGAPCLGRGHQRVAGLLDRGQKPLGDVGKAKGEIMLELVQDVPPRGWPDGQFHTGFFPA